MADSTSHNTSRGGRGKTASRALYPALAVATAALVFVQAVMAGRALFGSWSITAHGVAGNVAFGLALGLVAAAVLGRVGRHAIVVSAILVAVLTTQIGLGYAGRDSIEAAAWHVPNGVLAFGIAIYQLTILRRVGEASRSTSDIGRE